MHQHLRRLRPRTLAVTVALGLALMGSPPASADEVAPAGTAVWPLMPVPDVVEGFDPPRTRWGPGHRGVDLAGVPGQPVRSAMAGTVTFAGSLAGRGVVVVDHGTTRTTYEPVDPTVDVGNAVDAGDRLGRLQSGGSHCEPASCLHWGLLAGAEYLDPLTLVGAGPVRLLPLGSDSVGSVEPRTTWAASATFPSWPRAGSLVVPSRGDAALFRGG